MKLSNKNGNGLIITFLVVVIAALIGGIVYLGLRYQDLEDKYDSIELKNDKSSVSEETVDTDKNTSKDSGSNTSSNKYISRDEALEVVLKDLDVKEKDLKDLDIELESKMRYDNEIYEISFDYKLYEYEYYVDAITGKILDSFQSRD